MADLLPGQQAQQPITDAPKHGNGVNVWIKIIASAVVIIAILAVAYLVLGGTRNNTTGYAKLAVALATGKPLALSTVISDLNLSTDISAGAIKPQKPSNISYSGSGSYSVDYSGININVPFAYAVSSLVNGTYSRESVDMGILHSNISYTTIISPNETLICGNQNQTFSIASMLFGGAVQNQTAAPDYKCVLSAPLGSALPIQNASIMREANSIIRVLANNTYVNATVVRYTSYKGSPCTYVSGYIRSNTISLLTLLNSTQQAASGAGAPGLKNYTIMFSGPYSICLSTTSGVVYNFSVVQNIRLEYVQEGRTNNLNLSASVNGIVTSIGRPEQTSDIANAPYEVLNGTCGLGSVFLYPVNYPSTYALSYYSCGAVDMNYSGYLRLVLFPGESHFGYFNSTYPARPGTIRILGLACLPYNPSNLSGSYLAPGASSFYPTNITMQQGSAASLVFRCPAALVPGEGQYNANLYAVLEENFSGSDKNLSSFIASISVVPTVKGSLGQNNNTGRVPPYAVVSATPA